MSETPATTKQIFKLYWQHLRRYRAATIVVLGAIVVVNIVEVITPWFYKRFFDALAMGNGSPNIITALVKIILIIAGLHTLSWALYRTAGLTTAFLHPRVMTDLVQTAFGYLLHHSYHFFADNFAGSLVRKVNRLYRSFDVIADQVEWRLLQLIVTTAGILAVLFYRHSLLGLILFVWVVVFLAVNYYLARWKQLYDVLKAAKDSEVTGVLSDAVTNSVTIRLFSGYPEEIQRYHNVTEELRSLRSFSRRVDETIDGVQGAFMIIIEFTIMYLAVRLWQQGIVTIGDFALIQAYLIGIFNKLWDFGRVMRAIYEGLADAQEMITVLNMPYEVKDKRGAQELVVRRGRIEFKNVNFSFHQTRKVLNRFNLTIGAGERVALVGSSGAGKSTITHLLFRFYDIDAGKILIDGQDISKVTQMSLRDQIALVPQEPILFHRTLLDNIRYGRREASDAEVVEAAKQAHCHEFISELPLGYDTYVGERGIKLSGGERQRVAIARAILKNAPVLVLDEATSSLDSESEALIQDALKKLMKGKTVIVIAHRLSTILSMNRIIVIDEGRVVDMGTHQELLKKPGIYQTLWTIQAGGFLP